MIYTGYFARLHDYIECGLTPISIAGKSPDFYDGIEWKFLAPSLATYKNWVNNHNEFDYMNSYIPKINKLDKNIFKEKLLSIDNPILLCYESEGFCHRHLLADWIEMNLGLRVDEYIIPN